MLHLIPDDGQPHAATTECGCGPQLLWRNGRQAIVHTTDAALDEDYPARTASPRDHRIER